jgi:hypothetical protein
MCGVCATGAVGRSPKQRQRCSGRARILPSLYNLESRNRAAAWFGGFLNGHYPLNQHGVCYVKRSETLFFFGHLLSLFNLLEASVVRQVGDPRLGAIGKPRLRI